ncbi:alpha/beta hydrolase [Solibacillus sp. FSL W8-0372]|uniref:alpha/beta fold hydrolase n=1 Tax=Solibacillus sp. FSL W8-0372 TaxID=2921713 RepID=UPI0030D5C28F
MLHYTKLFSCHQKEWLVLLHGLGGKSTLFYKQTDYLKQHYNLLLIDLPGHGDSNGLDVNYYAAADVVPKITEVLEKLKIKHAHFLTFSLGTIIGNELMYRAKQYIKTMTLAGPVLKFNRWSSLLIQSAWIFRHFAPYMLFYKTFAYLIMPKKSHAKSRFYFVQEATKLGRKEFVKWTYLLKNARKPYEQLKQSDCTIPKFYLIGREDHLFLDEAKRAVENNPYASLQILDDCGHVCVIEKSLESNEAIHQFIESNQVFAKVSSL